MAGKRVSNRRWARAIPLVGLLALSLLWACADLRPDLLPDLAETAPYLERQVLPLALLSIAAAAIALARSAEWRPSLWPSIWIGLGLFTVPAVIVSVAGNWIGGLTRTALFTLAPVFALVFEPYLASPSAPQKRSGLLASLAAFAGSLLVFPVATPNSLPSAAAFVAVVAAAASIAAANCHGALKTASLGRDATGQLAAMASMAGAAGAVTLTAASALLEHPIWRWSSLAPELLWCMAIELPALLLLFWLMPRISAPRMTTRYVWAPLLALLAGVVLEHASRGVRPRTWLGLALMAAGAGQMLLAPREESRLSILPIAPLDSTRQ